MQILAPTDDTQSLYSLRQNVVCRFEEIFSEIRTKYPKLGSFILVVDAESLRVISSALKMADLLKMGVSSIEKLELKRKQHPKLHAIYILSSEKESVDLLIQDFCSSDGESKEAAAKKAKQLKKKKEEKKKKKKKNQDEDEDDDSDNEIIEEDEETKKLKKEDKKTNKKDQEPEQEEDVQYGRVHIYFRSKLPKTLLNQMAGAEKLVKRIRTMKELNHDFFFFEQNGFHLNLTNSLPILYSRKESQEASLLLECMTEKLLSIFPALLRFEKVSILFNNQDTSSISARFANSLEKSLQEQELRLKQSESKYIDNKAGEIFVLLVDRSIDPATPLIHDCSYQSMIYDLLEVDTYKNIVEYDKVEVIQDEKGEKKKEVKTYKQQLSDDKDEVFAKFRYLSITQSLNGIREDFEKHTAAMQKARVESNDDSKPKSIEDVQKIIRDYPQYKEMLSKYPLHFDLILRCYNRFEKWNLQLNCELEQAIVTGITDEGKKIQSEKLFPSLLEAISKKEIRSPDKTRLSLIANIALDLSSEQRIAIVNNLESTEQKLLKNLSWLGVYFSDDKKQTSFSKVNEKLVELSMQKYNAYLEKNKNCSACKRLRDEAKKSKKDRDYSGKRDCDQCGQLYFQFSVMRHTPLSALVANSVIKQILSFSFGSPQDAFQSLGFGRKLIGSQNKSQDIKQPEIEQEDSKVQKEQEVEKGTKKKEKKSKKGEVAKIVEGDLRPKNEFQALLEGSQHEQDDEELKKVNKVIVFFIGGVSYAEIRAIRKFQEENYSQIPVIIGGTHLLTPSSYLQGLSEMTIFG